LYPEKKKSIKTLFFVQGTLIVSDTYDDYISG
jgi:hypothetical protein